MMPPLKQFDRMMVFLALFVTGMILPVLLIVIIHFTGASIVVEELAKWLIVLTLVMRLPKKTDQLFAAGFFGCCFALSETGFYAGQLFTGGQFETVFTRLVFTTPLHLLTCVILAATARKGRLASVLGLFAAIGLHWLFNTYLAS